MKNQVLLLAFLFCVGFAFAQDGDASSDMQDQIDAVRPGKTHMMVRGYVEGAYEFAKDADGAKEKTFAPLLFSPIFMARHSDNLLFFSQLEVVMEGDNHTHVAIEFAELTYYLGENTMLTFGKFLLPYGVFMPRMHPPWIDRLGGAKPLGFGDYARIFPHSGVGMKLSGGAELGEGRFTYDLYTTNGFTMRTNSLGLPIGQPKMKNYADQENLGKAYGARVAFLPSDASLEIGLSILNGPTGGGEIGSAYEDVRANLIGADLTYVKFVPGLGGNIDIRSQWGNMTMDDATYYNGSSIARFDNKSSAWFAQFAYRPTMSTSLNKFQLAAGFSGIDTPDESSWGQDLNQFTLALNFWASWRNVIRLGYQNTHSKVGNGVDDTSIYLAWALGL